MPRGGRRPARAARGDQEDGGVGSSGSHLRRGRATGVGAHHCARGSGPGVCRNCRGLWGDSVRGRGGHQRVSGASRSVSATAVSTASLLGRISSLSVLKNTGQLIRMSPPATAASGSSGRSAGGGTTCWKRSIGPRRRVEPSANSTPAHPRRASPGLPALRIVHLGTHAGSGRTGCRTRRVSGHPACPQGTSTGTSPHTPAQHANAPVPRVGSAVRKGRTAHLRMGALC